MGQACAPAVELRGCGLLHKTSTAGLYSVNKGNCPGLRLIVRVAPGSRTLPPPLGIVKNKRVVCVVTPAHTVTWAATTTGFAGILLEFVLNIRSCTIFLLRRLIHADLLTSGCCLGCCCHCVAGIRWSWC